MTLSLSLDSKSDESGPTLQLSTNLQGAYSTERTPGAFDLGCCFAETRSDQLRDSAQLSIHSSNVSEYKQREFNSTANVSGYPPLNSNVSNSTREVASSIPVPLDKSLMDQSASEQLQGESQLAAEDADQAKASEQLRESQLAAEDAVQAVEKATGAAVAADAAEFGGRKYPRKVDSSEFPDMDSPSDP